MKRKFLLLIALLFSATLLQAQLVPAGKGVLKAVTKTGTQQAVKRGVTDALTTNLFLSPTHLPLQNYATNSLSFIPKPTVSLEADISRLEVAQQVLWERITLEQQREFARMALVPAYLSEQVSPSLAQIFLPDRGEDFVANGFIVNYGGTNWVALSYHVGGKVGNKRLIKILLKDGTEVSFNGFIEVAGNAGYHEADVSFVRIPAQWQDQVTALEVAAPDPELPAYSFGSVAEDSQHNDFFPVKRTILGQSGTSIRMTHDIPGDDPLNPASISGYCGSPIIQEIDGAPRVVGVFTGHVNPVSADYPAISFAIDLSKTMPILMDNPAYTRTLMFLGEPVAQIPINERLEQMSVYRDGPSGKQLVSMRSMYHFPNNFSYENAEQAFFDTELRSGDVVSFLIKNRHYYTVEYTIP